MMTESGIKVPHKTRYYNSKPGPTPRLPLRFLFISVLSLSHLALGYYPSPPRRSSFHKQPLTWSSHCHQFVSSFSGNICNPLTKTRQTLICTAKIHQRLHSLKLQVAAFPPTHDIVASLFAVKNVPLWQAFAINAVLFSTFSSKLLKSLTSEGFAHAMVLGTLLWATLGFRGWLVCVSYLIFGSVVTKIRFEEKEAAGIAEARGGRRGPENVWGSALVALICAACSVQGDSFLGIESSCYVLAFVSSLATKLADTFASEIGKAYGKTAFLITTFERVPPGTEGAISVEGTVAAIVGGALLSIIGCGLLKEISFPGGVAISTTASFLATNAESVIGASTQGKKGFTWMTNEVVNFLNTLIGAGIAIAGGKILL